MQIKSNYLGSLRTEATHLKSNNKLITDAPTDNQGQGQAFSPTDLVAASLTSCMMTIMGIEARKNDTDIEGLSAETTKVMKAEPREIARIKILFEWPDCQLDENLRAQLKEKALSCPVALSLSPNIVQEVTFSF